MKKILSIFRRLFCGEYVCPNRRRSRCSNFQCPYHGIVLFFALLLSSVASARVECWPVNNNRWVCEGDGLTDPDSPTTVVTNFLGVCTNCVNMSPAQCEGLKGGLSGQISRAIIAIRDIYNASQASKAEISEFKSKWDQMQINSYTISTLPPQYETVVQWAEDQIQYPYVVTVAGPGGSTKGTGDNSIANYYQKVVSPFLDQLESRFVSFENSSLQASGELESLMPVVGQIDCSECRATPNAPGDPVDPGGGGGGGGSSGGECCDHGPMLEQMQGLRDAVDRIELHIGGISNSVASIERQFKDYSTKVLSLLSSISNSVDRIDDYVYTDLDRILKSIETNTISVSNFLDSVQRDFYEAYKHAQEMQDKDGNDFNITNEAALVYRDGGFDVDQYKRLPWFSRIEMLLYKISSPGSVSTNTPEEVSEVLKEVEALEGEVETQKEDVDKAFENSSRSFSKITDALTSIAKNLQFFGNGSQNTMPEFATINLQDFDSRLSAFTIAPSSDVSSIIEPLLNLLRIVMQIVYLLSFCLALFFVFRYGLAKFGKLCVAIYQFYVACFGAK